MLPKNKLGKSIIKKLKIFKGPEHEHGSQKPIEWNYFVYAQKKVFPSILSKIRMPK